MAFPANCRHPVFTAAPAPGGADHAGGVRGYRREAGRVQRHGEPRAPGELPPTAAISRLVNSLKEVSSRRLRQEFRDLARHYWRTNRLWSGSCFAGSAGGSSNSVLRQYIEQQDRPAW